MNIRNIIIVHHRFYESIWVDQLILQLKGIHIAKSNICTWQWTASLVYNQEILEESSPINIDVFDEKTAGSSGIYPGIITKQKLNYCIILFFFIHLVIIGQLPVPNDEIISP